jgi:RimJ/RimL family protein N-acetyltransferase
VIVVLRATPELLDAALASDEALTQALGCEVAPGWASFPEALAPARDALVSAPDGFAWGARLFLSEDPRELVGWGGFKGPPAAGLVELGYEVAEGRRGRGLATAATRAMVAEALADARVRAVIAHTLARRNASTRVLEKAGFEPAGQARENGRAVWRFKLTRRPPPQRLTARA